MNIVPEVRETSPCHARELFVKYNGVLYPCCRVGGGDGQVCEHGAQIIGHVGDPDLAALLRKYAARCLCPGRRLRPLRQDETLGGGRLNIEFSLRCQGDCAFCCVFAPLYSGAYDLYPHLERLIELYRPGEILVQGGEVLVQPETLAWIASMRRRRPEVPFLMATNGCVGPNMADTVEALFTAVNISIAGFQPETYRVVMGLDLERTKRFARELCARDKTRVQLKYMATPNNIHELPLFLEWAAAVRPDSVAVETVNLGQYINMDTFDDFWRKMFERTGRRVAEVVSGLFAPRIEGAVTPWFSGEARRLLHLDQPGTGEDAPSPGAGPTRDDVLDSGCDQAWGLMDRGEHDAAGRLLAELRSMEPRHAGISHALAILALKDGRLDAALAHARDGLEHHPGDAELRRSLAVILARQGRFEEALDGLRRLVADGPHNWTAHMALCDVNRYAGRWAQALVHLDRALAIHPMLQRGVGAKRRAILAELEKQEHAQ